MWLWDKNLLCSDTYFSVSWIQEFMGLLVGVWVCWGRRAHDGIYSQHLGNAFSVPDIVHDAGDTAVYKMNIICRGAARWGLRVPWPNPLMFWWEKQLPKFSDSAPPAVRTKMLISLLSRYSSTSPPLFLLNSYTTGTLRSF